MLLSIIAIALKKIEVWRSSRCIIFTLPIYVPVSDSNRSFIAFISVKASFVVLCSEPIRMSRVQRKKLISTVNRS